MRAETTHDGCVERAACALLAQLDDYADRVFVDDLAMFDAYIGPARNALAELVNYHKLPLDGPGPIEPAERDDAAALADPACAFLGLLDDAQAVLRVQLAEARDDYAELSEMLVERGTICRADVRSLEELLRERNRLLHALWMAEALGTEPVRRLLAQVVNGALVAALEELR